MDNNSVYGDEPTKPMPPSWPSNQDQQGKMVVGSFQNPRRQPYQYPPRQNPPQAVGPAPVVTPNVRGYPFWQPGQVGGPRPQWWRRIPLRRGGCLVGCLTLLVLA